MNPKKVYTILSWKYCLLFSCNIFCFDQNTAK